MFEFHALRALLGLMQIGIVWILLKRDIGYLWRFGITMFASAALNLAPSHPNSESWQQLIQIPAYVVIFILMGEATVELFAFLRRRTFIEERSALFSLAAVAGMIPVWVCWYWPGDDWYQSALLVRQYALMWLAGAYLTAWCWLRAVRPIHMELQIADHGEFWGFWLLSAAAHASTTKYGLLWRFAQWHDGESIWRITGDALLLAQLCICFGFMVNLWKWRNADGDVAQAGSPDLPALAPYHQRGLLHL
jgi:hypothetical protein